MRPVCDVIRECCVALVACVVLLSLTGAAAANGQVRVLTMGDSMMATHKSSKKAVSHAMRQQLGVSVVDRSASGARMIYRLPISGSLGLSIPKQFRPGQWDWIVLNGGGNDLLLGFGCRRCDAKMNQLIANDGRSGEIPKLIQKLRRTGAQVVYVGYLRSPGAGSVIERCRDEGDLLESRITAYAAKDSGVHFVSLADMVKRGDRSLHEADMVHPSPKGSREIARRIGQVILQ
jgi:acyl-CoA thioesterase-1